MAYDYSGSGQYHRATQAVVTAAPLTMACWFNADSATTNGVLMSMLDEGSNNWTGFYLVCGGTDVGDPFQAAAVNNNSFVSASTSTGYSTGVWMHGCGVYTSDTSRTAYLDGGSAVTDTTSCTPSAIMDNTVIGSARRTIADNGFDGRIAEAGIWNTDLTAAEVLSLAEGVSPLKVRPQSLVFYAPLIREVLDIRGGRALAATGSPAVAVHPRVYGL